MKKISILIISLITTTTLMATVNAKTCAFCHGKDWSKKALGIGLDVSQMTHAEIAISLKGYMDGSYGSSKAELMKAQIAKYSVSELEEFSLTIGK
ncbi:MAG: cytochrome C [Sulfurimonas sp.]|nr:cytochrome C [Sulfurimonas sp.]